MDLACLVSVDGVYRAGALQGEPDLLIFCSDGILAACQVQLAAASVWLKDLLVEAARLEERNPLTIFIPFVTKQQMNQVLELICTGSVVLKEQDISSLVEISSMLGCIGDMLKEPVTQTEAILPRLADSKGSINDKIILQSAGGEIKLSLDPSQQQQLLEPSGGINQYLDQIYQLHQTRMTRMEAEEAEEKERSAKRKWSNWSQSPKKSADPVKKEEVVDSDDFVVEDEDEDDDEGYIRKDYSYKKKKKIEFNLEEFEEQLMELGESTASRGGAGVQCGLCDGQFSVPEDKKVKSRINHFKKNHYNKCLKRMAGEGEEEEEEGIKEEDEEDCLEEVYKEHVAKKEVDNFKTAQGRRKADIPPIETIRAFLAALGKAKIVNKGHKVLCGLCRNKLRVNPGRTIMGNIRYFERTHLLRCPVRIAKIGKPTELISESFIPGRTPTTRILKNIHVFDFEKGELVAQIIGEKDDYRRTPGRPRKGEELAESKVKKEYYLSKRKQCLAACLICFTCNAPFDTALEIEDHFACEHPDIEAPYYCLACQEHFKSHDELSEHLDTDHNYKNNYNCPFCDQEDFITQSKLNRHISEEHPNEELLYTCNMCTKGFSSFHALKNHQKSHTNIHPDMVVDPKSMLSSMQEAFNCRFCGLNIMYGKHLDQHIREAHAEMLQVGEEAYTCRICPKDSPSYQEFYHLENHLREHGITMEHICRFCRAPHYNRNKFIQHFKEEHKGEHPYECPRYGCDKTFPKKQKLQDHIVLHRVKEGDISEEMKKLCMECGKVFYVRKKLELHVKMVHGGVGLLPSTTSLPREKKHQCHLCVKTFQTNSLLQGHLRKHDNNPCFMCDHCGKGFYRKDRLAVHTRSVHLGQKNFQCEVCEKKFIDSYKLRRHMKTHTSARGQNAAAAPVVVVSTPGTVAYETIVPTIIRKPVVGLEEQHVTIQQIGSSAGPTILQVTTQPPHIAKRTTIQNFIKFEDDTLEAEATPVDFTQQGDNKIHTQYILSTSLYET